MKKKGFLRFLLFLIVLSALTAANQPLVGMYNVGIMAMIKKWGMNLGWMLVASAGFGLGTGIAIKIFDLISKDINEWEEVKKGNMGVVAILVSIIVMVGIIVIVSIW